MRDGRLARVYFSQSVGVGPHSLLLQVPAGEGHPHGEGGGSVAGKATQRSCEVRSLVLEDACTALLLQPASLPELLDLMEYVQGEAGNSAQHAYTCHWFSRLVIRTPVASPDEGVAGLWPQNVSQHIGVEKPTCGRQKDYQS